MIKAFIGLQSKMQKSQLTLMPSSLLIILGVYSLQKKCPYINKHKMEKLKT